MLLTPITITASGHVIKTKFVENEKRVLKEHQQKKKRKDAEEKKRKLVSDGIWTYAFGREKQRKNTEVSHSTTPASAEELC